MALFWGRTVRQGGRVPPVVASLFGEFIFRPVLKPVLRFVSGAVAIPLFRFLLRRVCRLQVRDAELERDLELWFRGSVLLLAATANLEDFLFGWVPFHMSDVPWFIMPMRLLLAIGVIESMPDQDVFGILHRGPPPVRFTPSGLKRAWAERKDILRGLWVLHLKRSSPVFAIMCVIFGPEMSKAAGVVGWLCYGLAVTQYLIIGLVTCRDRAGDVLGMYDQRVAEKRNELVVERAGLGCASPEPESREWFTVRGERRD